MLKPSLEKALNQQINKELYSAYLYQAMSAYASRTGLPGVANWMDIQSKEEMDHARKFYNYINEQGAKITLMAIDQPETDFETVNVMFSKTLEHEQFITKSIHDLVTLARDEHDYATEIFLQWYITEQVEEESNVNELIDKLNLIGKEGNGIFMFDKELASRVYTPMIFGD